MGGIREAKQTTTRGYKNEITKKRTVENSLEIETNGA